MGVDQFLEKLAENQELDFGSSLLQFFETLLMFPKFYVKC